MIFIFIDSVLLAALIFGGLATGAGVTSVVGAFILKHKTVIVVITVLGVLVSEIDWHVPILNQDYQLFHKSLESQYHYIYNYQHCVRSYFTNRVYCNYFNVFELYF